MVSIQVSTHSHHPRDLSFLTVLCKTHVPYSPLNLPSTKGYYLLAFTIWLLSQCERLGRRKISPYFSPKKWSFYGVMCIFTIHSLGSYSTTAFFLRSFENVLENWKSHHFWGHITCVLFYVIVSQFPDPPNYVVDGYKKEKDLIAKIQRTDVGQGKKLASIILPNDSVSSEDGDIETPKRKSRVAYPSLDTKYS
jgi:hypothetical protein